MRRRRKESDEVEIDPGSKSLGLEDLAPERKDKIESYEVHKAGEKCLHWRRLPNGAVGFMDARAARVAPCRFCMGLGVLLGDIRILKREVSRNWIVAEDLKKFEEARRTVRPRRVA